jgi:hypothetical protein
MIRMARITPSGDPEPACDATGPAAERSTMGTVELVDRGARVVGAVDVEDLGVDLGFDLGFEFAGDVGVARAGVVVGSSVMTGAVVGVGPVGSVAAVTGGRRVVGGATVVVVEAGGGIAADGETLGSACRPNANASMLPACG